MAQHVARSIDDPASTVLRQERGQTLVDLLGAVNQWPQTATVELLRRKIARIEVQPTQTDRGRSIARRQSQFKAPAGGVDLPVAVDHIASDGRAGEAAGCRRRDLDRLDALPRPLQQQLQTLTGLLRRQREQGLLVPGLEPQMQTRGGFGQCQLQRPFGIRGNACIGLCLPTRCQPLDPVEPGYPVVTIAVEEQSRSGPMDIEWIVGQWHRQLRQAVAAQYRSQRGGAVDQGLFLAAAQHLFDLAHELQPQQRQGSDQHRDQQQLRSKLHGSFTRRCASDSRHRGPYPSGRSADPGSRICAGCA